MRKTKKSLVAMGLSTLLLLSTACGNGTNTNTTATASKPNKAFDEFLEELFVDSVSESTLNLHFTLKDPSAYGLEDMEPSLGDLTDMDFSNSPETWEEFTETFDELKTFDYSKLNQEQQLTYDILYRYMDLESSMIGCPYQGTAFGRISGIQSNMPLNMSLYEFYSKKDVEDYLALLDLIDDYFDYCIAYEEYRTQQGYGLTDGSIDEIVSQCEVFLENKEDNYLISTFDHRIDQLEGLTQEERADYKEQNKNLVLNNILPCYEETITDISALKGKCVDKGGLCNYPGGLDYYTYMIKSETGTTKSIEELEDVLEDTLEDSIDMMMEAITEDPSLYNAYLIGNSTMSTDSPSDPGENLENFKVLMEGVYPTPPEITYTISDIDPSIADILSPAFCVTPCIDDYTHGVIQVNRSPDNHSSGPLGILYAHEGYPGHLYQLTYFLSQDPYPIRSSLNFLGYTEGWAMYTELRAYNWINYIDHDDDSAAKFDVSLSLQNMALCCLADIQVNYHGATRQELSDYFDEHGFNGEAANDLYDMMVEEPAYYPHYFVGYLEFIELRHYAQAALGSSFSDLEFHEVILKTGPCDFYILRQELDKYIADKKANAA